MWIPIVLALTPSVVANAQDEPWKAMDYGPFLATAVDIGDGMVVPKGLVVPLMDLEGEPSGLHAVFDTETCQWRCVWRGELSLEGIVFDGPHGTFPRVEGDVAWRVPAMPGVFPEELEEACRTDPRPEPFGPLDPNLVRFVGVHVVGDDIVLEMVADEGRTRILDRVWGEDQTVGDFPIMMMAHQLDIRSIEGAKPIEFRVRAVENTDGRPATTCGDEDNGWRSNGISTVRFHEGVRTIYQLDTGLYLTPRLMDQDLPDLETFLAGARRTWTPDLVLAGELDVRFDDRARWTQRAFDAHSDPTTWEVVEPSADPIRLHGRSGASSDSMLIGSEGPDWALLLPAEGWRPAGELPTDRRDAWVGYWPCDFGSGAHEGNRFRELTEVQDRDLNPNSIEDPFARLDMREASKDLRLDGVTWRRGIRGRSLDFDGTAAAWPEDVRLRPEREDFTVAAWVHTTRDGSVFSIAPAPEEGEACTWAPGGVTLFLRDGCLAFDVGWVDVVESDVPIADGTWHHVAASYVHDDGRVELFVDGVSVAVGHLPIEEGDTDAFVPRFGWTCDDFPETSRFSGFLDGLLLVREVLDEAAIERVAATTGQRIVEATVLKWSGAPDEALELRVVQAGGRHHVRVEGPAPADPVVFESTSLRGPLLELRRRAQSISASTDGQAPFRIDRLTWPDENPWDSWMRFGAFDFETPTSALITTWSGDVWRVRGLDEDLDALTWQRVATGLNQPFGVEVTKDGAFVLGRDQITRLHDRNGDGEADFLEAVTNLHHNSEHFHEPASGLILDADGHFWFIKAARHAKLGLHDHHGTVLRVAPDRDEVLVAARGFRAPIGLTMLPDGSLLGSDQEGHWMPANRINLIRPNPDDPLFYGNGWGAGATPVERVVVDGERVHPPVPVDAPYEPPLCWLHPSVDRSPSSQVWVDHEAWGPLNESILGLSYGTGDVYLVLRDDVQADHGSFTQGGVVKLGIQLPTGLLHGRIHPDSGDLYVCGLFGWSSDRTQAGGFYRVRPRADGWVDTLNVPHRMRATATGLELTFLHPLDATRTTDPESWEVEAWNYRRTEDYGSATYDLDGREGARTRWTVGGVELLEDGRTVRLSIDGFRPAMQVHVAWSIADAIGRALDHEAHLTVHATHPD